MIHLNYRDSRPIYEQVRDGFRELLILGAILPGEKLPSVRVLASQLAINPNTIQRAYKALEKAGYIYTQMGKGNFVAELGEAMQGRKQELFQRFDKIVKELFFFGVSPEELGRRLMEGQEEGK